MSAPQILSFRPGYANNLGFLRNSLGLVDYPAGGMVVATKRLFPDGLS